MPYQREPFEVASFDLGGGPTRKADLAKGSLNVAPRHIVICGADVTKAVFLSTKTLDIELHAAMSKSVNP